MLHTDGTGGVTVKHKLHTTLFWVLSSLLMGAEGMRARFYVSPVLGCQGNTLKAERG